MKCFFHSADLDGHCSGAIIKDRHPKCEMMGINYGQSFPWDSITSGETVFMVDFTLQPFDDMERLHGMCNLIWIDHHKTEVEEAEKRAFSPKGIRRIGIGACQLVWEYLYPNDSVIPAAIKLLAEYDVWNHSDPRTLPFQYGFRFFENTFPSEKDLWDRFLTCEAAGAINNIIKIGQTILAYEERQNKKFCAAYAFDTFLGNGDGLPYRAIACNRGFTNSKLFESMWDENKYDLMISFCRLKLPAKKWTVSLYSTKSEIDCGQIARIFGGGGHKGAAGFQCDALPFEY